jgi:hypothetical protein
VSEPRPQTLPTLVGDILADEIGGKTVHRAVAGRIDDKIGRQLRPVVEPDASLGDLLDLAALELDLAVDDKLARADVDVIARAVPQVFHEQPRVVGAPIMPEARPFEAGVELRLALLDLLIERDLELVQDAIGDRGEDEIGAMVIDARLDHLLGVERAEANVRQRVRAHDVGRGALDHCQSASFSHSAAAKAPAHLPRWLLMRVLAYRLQSDAFGDLDKSIRRKPSLREGRWRRDPLRQARRTDSAGRRTEGRRAARS